METKLTSLYEARRKSNRLYNNNFKIDKKLLEGDYSTDLNTLINKLELSVYNVDFNEYTGTFGKMLTENKALSFVFKDSDGYTISLNRDISLKYKRFAVACMIGHFFLNHLIEEGSYEVLFNNFLLEDIKSLKEDVVNAFAMELMLPELLITHVYETTGSAIKTANVFGVPVTVVISRLTYLGLI